MMSSNRRDYSSASEWLSILRHDEAWLSQRRQLQEASAADVSALSDEALRRIGNGETYEYWKIYQHQVEPVVKEVWEIAELSLPKLKIQIIGMLSMEWIEQLGAALKTGANGDKAGCEDEIPEALATSPLWEKVKQAGLVDENGQPTVSRPEAALMADVLARHIGISNKWKMFEKLWHRNNMRGDYNTALNQRKSLELQDELKKILG